MNMEAFNKASGISAMWLDHWIVSIIGTLVVLSAAAIVGMLIHRLDVNDNISNVHLISYVLFVIMIVFIFLGFLNNFWF